MSLSLWTNLKTILVFIFNNNSLFISLDMIRTLVICNATNLWRPYPKNKINLYKVLNESYLYIHKNKKI